MYSAKVRGLKLGMVSSLAFRTGAAGQHRLDLRWLHTNYAEAIFVIYLSLAKIVGAMASDWRGRAGGADRI